MKFLQKSIVSREWSPISYLYCRTNPRLVTAEKKKGTARLTRKTGLVGSANGWKI
jgi:hypothetical protein